MKNVSITKKSILPRDNYSILRKENVDVWSLSCQGIDYIGFIFGLYLYFVNLMRIFFLLLTCRVTLSTVFHFAVVSDIVYRNGSSINAPDCKRFFYIPPVIETAYQSSRVYRKFMNFRDNSLSLFFTWKSCGLLTFPLATLSDRRAIY